MEAACPVTLKFMSVVCIMEAVSSDCPHAVEAEAMISKAIAAVHLWKDIAVSLLFTLLQTAYKVMASVNPFTYKVLSLNICRPCI